MPKTIGLSADDSKRRDGYVSELQELHGKLVDAIAVYNAALAVARGELMLAYNAYNSTVNEAKGFADDIASVNQEIYDERSEKWQESEKGEAAKEWIDEWESAELEEFEDPFADEEELEAPDCVSEKLEALNVEPEGSY